MRNTPTHVGKTDRRNRLRREDKKHPHARGEDQQPVLFPLPFSETPPRTWGRLDHGLTPCIHCGNTPTHVGKTGAGRPHGAYPWKHPHARGEDLIGHKTVKIKRETPPRTWGRLDHGLTPCIHCGNTPTHVGKTDESPNGMLGQEKHPHARGEDPPMMQKKGPSAETPPRTWGRPSLTHEGN